MKLEDVKDNMYVEWSFGGLAKIMGKPFRKWGQDEVYIFPLNTGDPSTGTGKYKRAWPVAQLEPADMDTWTFDAARNMYLKIYTVRRTDVSTNEENRPGVLDAGAGS